MDEAQDNDAPKRSRERSDRSGSVTVTLVGVNREAQLPLIRNASRPTCRVGELAGEPVLAVYLEDLSAGAHGGPLIDVVCTTDDAEVVLTFDVSRGARIALPAADTYQVTARVVGSGAGVSYRFNAFLTWGSKGTTSPGVVTSAAQTLVATMESTKIPIPQGARTVYAVGTNHVEMQDTIIRFYAADATLRYTRTNPDTVREPIVLGAASVTFTSKVGAPNFDIAAVFEIA